MIEWDACKRTVVETSLPMGARMERTVLFNDCEGKGSVQIELEWDLGMASMFIEEEKMQAMMEKSLEKTAENWKKRAVEI